MKRISHVAAWLLWLASFALAAHGPARVKLADKIDINAPAEKVWGIISDFCGVKNWNPLITDCANDKGNETGSVRTITLDNGVQVEQTLAKHMPDRFRIQYYMTKKNPEAYPISSHGVIFTIIPNEDGKSSILELKGNFYRLFQGQTPPAGQTDEDGKAALMRIHRAGMENVKKLAEQ
ncbi:MAG: SRPBCC family protein [Candidatus Eutrophobiaceae bacterium]